MMTIILTVAALLPAAVMLAYIYKKDNAEKEPPALLIKLFFAGALSCVPAALIELVLGSVYSVFDNSVIISTFLASFGSAGLVEELCKFAFLYKITKDNKNFNSVFDGVIYSVFIGLGFAGAENILYVFQSYAESGISGGFSTAFLRALTPGHLFFAVFMGYFYSMYHIYELSARMENQYAASRMLVKRTPEISGNKYLASAIILPILIHGFFDFCLMYGEHGGSDTVSGLLIVAFFIFIIALYIVCFKKIKQMSRVDGPDTYAAAKILYGKYPEFLEYAKRVAAANAQRASQQQYQYHTVVQQPQQTYQQPVQQPYQYPAQQQYQNPTQQQYQSQGNFTQENRQ